MAQNHAPRRPERRSRTAEQAVRRRDKELFHGEAVHQARWVHRVGAHRVRRPLSNRRQHGELHIFHPGHLGQKEDRERVQVHIRARRLDGALQPQLPRGVAVRRRETQEGAEAGLNRYRPQHGAASGGQLRVPVHPEPHKEGGAGPRPILHRKPHPVSAAGKPVRLLHS